MQVDEMNEHCGLGTWGSNSRCVLASSDDPAGPYTRDLVLIDSWYSARALFLDTRGNVPPVPPSFMLPKIGVIPPLTSTLVRLQQFTSHFFNKRCHGSSPGRDPKSGRWLFNHMGKLND